MFFRKKSLVESNKDARALLASAEKVFNYRGDLFSDEERERFDADVAALKSAGTRDEIADAIEQLDGTLRVLGGKVFPQNFLSEGVDLIVVAAILVFGIRSFFFQPFKIPTNSMYPTYNGMTAEICSKDVAEPAKWIERIFRSASFYEFRASESGEVAVSFSKSERIGNADIFEIMIGSNIMKLELPRDFSIDSVLLQRFFPDEFEKKDLSLAERRNNVFRRVSAGTLQRVSTSRSKQVFIKTGVRVERGESFLNFKIFGGDMVIVDRISYNFTAPKVGDPFVFRTQNIAGLNNAQLYYIKRLAGTHGDTLQVRNNQLFLNDKLITGADAFAKNNSQDFKKEYYGYLPAVGGGGIYSIPLNEPFTVPANSYYAMGDNSSNSYDSRGWGIVPAEDAVGRALFVLYPFSANWGIAE